MEAEFPFSNEIRGAIIDTQAWSGRTDAARWRRRGWLALVGALHGLAFLCWTPPARPPAPSVKAQAGIAYILMPARARKPAEALARLTRVPTAAVSAAAAATPPRKAPRNSPFPVEPISSPPFSASADQPARTPATPQAITIPTPDPFAPAAPARAADDLKQRALNSAAAADRQLRKESWNPRDKKIANDSTALAAAIGGAYVGNDGPLNTEQVMMPDGTMMTRAHTAAGTFCAHKESNALTGGRDPFRDGVRTLITSCPRGARR